MDPKSKLAALLKRASELAVKATGPDGLSDVEMTEVEGIPTEVDGLKAQIKRVEDTTRMLTGLATQGPSVNDAPPAEEMFDASKSGSIGDRFVNSEGFKAFQKQHPSGTGSGSPIRIEGRAMGSMKSVIGRKADSTLLTSPQGFVVPQRLATVDLTIQPPLTVLDLISKGETNSNAVTYLQITSITRGAAVVAETTVDGGGTLADPAGTTAAGGLKPKSALSTNLATEPVFTYADGIDVTNQTLADAPALATFMNTMLEYNLQNEIQNEIINGTGADGEPTGILRTTGVQNQATVDKDGVATLVQANVDRFVTVRSAITKVTKLGGVVQAVVVSPEDDELFDIARNQIGSFLGAGPFQSGPATLWGRPRVVCNALNQGEFLLGDFRQVILLQREGLSVNAYNQHKDYAQRNLVYVRAELRAAQVILQPYKLVVGSFIAD